MSWQRHNRGLRLWVRMRCVGQQGCDDVLVVARLRRQLGFRIDIEIEVGTKPMVG